MKVVTTLIVLAAVALGVGISGAVSFESSLQAECVARAADLKTEFRWDRGRGCRLRRGDVYVPAHLAELAAAGITEVRQ